MPAAHNSANRVSATLSRTYSRAASISRRQGWLTSARISSRASRKGTDGIRVRMKRRRSSGMEVVAIARYICSNALYCEVTDCIAFQLEMRFQSCAHLVTQAHALDQSRSHTIKIV